MIQEHHFNDTFFWPEGVRLVIGLTFDFQGGEHVKVGPDGFMDYEEYAIGEYGPNAGIFRLLRMLKEEDVKATFYTCGAIAERYPAETKLIQADGHEIGGHGYHHEVARKLKREDENDVIQRATAMIDTVIGQRPMGWRSCTQSLNTIELLLDHGYAYNSNSFSHDLPFLWTKGDKSLVELPRHPFGDGRAYGPFDIGNPDNALKIWSEAFDELYRESRHIPGYLPFQLHPYISGRPGRTEALRRTIKHMSRAGVWFATGAEITAWCKSDVFKRKLAKAS